MKRRGIVCTKISIYTHFDLGDIPDEVEMMFNPECQKNCFGEPTFFYKVVGGFSKDHLSWTGDEYTVVSERKEKQT